MKVLDLACSAGHGFEGWFASEDDYLRQHAGALVACPFCGDTAITRKLSAPRLNLSRSRAEAAPALPPDSVAAPPALPAARVSAPAAWLAAVRELVASTEDVGPRFAEEARRIHYGEQPPRGIRGQATPEQRQALQEEGIETISVALPPGLQRPLQ